MAASWVEDVRAKRRLLWRPTCTEFWNEAHQPALRQPDPDSRVAGVGTAHGMFRTDGHVLGLVWGVYVCPNSHKGSLIICVFYCM